MFLLGPWGTVDHPIFGWLLAFSSEREKQFFLLLRPELGKLVHDHPLSISGTIKLNLSLRDYEREDQNHHPCYDGQ
jgi:hypothetical protein